MRALTSAFNRSTSVRSSAVRYMVGNTSCHRRLRPDFFKRPEAGRSPCNDCACSTRFEASSDEMGTSMRGKET